MSKKKLSIILSCLLVVLFTTCRTDEWEENSSQDYDPKVLKAKQWYEENSSSLSVKREDGSPIQELIPDWGQARRKSNKWEETIEVDMEKENGIGFALSENKEKYEETDDERYLASTTRLVIRTKKRTKKTDGFLMTVISSPDYLERIGFEPPREVAYIGRDKHFSGQIIYHSLDGKFVNGWVYQNGKITHRMGGSNENSIKRMATRCYDATICVYSEYCNINCCGANGQSYSVCTWVLSYCYDTRICEEVPDDVNGENGEDDPGSGGGGGGGGYYGGGSGGSGQGTPITNTCMVGTHSLNPERAALLQATIDSLFQECFFRGMNQRFLTDQYLPFSDIVVDPNIIHTVGAAATSTKYRLIVANDDVLSNRYAIREEFFHLFQLRAYPIKASTNPDHEKMPRDSVSGYLEFEAKLMADIQAYYDGRTPGVDHSHPWALKDATDEQKDEYATWLDKLTVGRTRWPFLEDFIDWDASDNTYKQYMEYKTWAHLFLETNGSYNNIGLNTNYFIAPTALTDITDYYHCNQ